MIHYSVKKLAQISGVSIRTLHHYDKIGLLKPSVRTEARYRMYGEPELIRLQQILFYKELDFSLQKIAAIMDDPDFNTIDALESHRILMQSRADRISQLLTTIDKTILKLKGKIMLTDKELYAGLSTEKTESYRTHISDAYGADTLQRSENSLKQLGKSAFVQLKKDFADLYTKLAAQRKENPESVQVQELIAEHYKIIRMFWGTAGTEDAQYNTYKGLGELYVSNPLYAQVDGKPDEAFARFMKASMYFFVASKLNQS
ncbi:MerR family transcriptional regulator [Cytophaga hutchinsonii]|uniref:Transcriptional regulator, MerR family n=1 Tax=Cytophaga hutchinsonii (strain ATCC 33406 / DSM 1761 / CIP 103989 / NBRC 15051 / NCIMB 9469 / D465) TaxID=269798 RepID=A0A6N4ST26_CYTH3|nr:MerR family transcriptional regulator [Cytophaga hutchinsonii]ABG59570.1 transcriptional regulator, MerR family [Cytophaga hutchinsonii ATCC 33406]SFY03365.1 transcriptional regulator, MerR family [Cytophaga hutchinsonii ATCC 33406]